MESQFKKVRITYQKRLEIALIISLSLMILVFLVVPRRFAHQQPEIKPVFIRFDIEDIPLTKQYVKRGQPKPRRPVIPLPTEEPSVPEDETIEETNINWNIGDSPFALDGITASRADTIPPRPLVQVFPEYPEQERKRNIAGTVRLLVKINSSGKVINVVVSKNTTGSKLCERAAVQAAYRSTYIPAKSANRNIAMWTICDYGFKPD